MDDASNDDTVKIATRYLSGEPRIKFLSQNQNKGVAESRNLALENATGKYIAFLDSDDLWLPEKLEQQISFMETEAVNITYAAYQRIDESGKKLGRVTPPATLDYDMLLRSNFIGNLTGVYDAATLGKQYFSKHRHEDYVAWLALLKRAGTAKSVDAELAMYRVYSGSTSSNKIRTVKWQWQIYRNAQGLGLFRSFWLMGCYAFYAIQKRV